MKNINSVNIIVISDLQYNLKTIQKDGGFTAICAAVSIAPSSLSIFIVQTFMLEQSYLRVCCHIYISDFFFPQHGYLGLQKQFRRSQKVQIWQYLQMQTWQYLQRAWHYEGRKSYASKHSFHIHSNGITWVQLSPDVLHLTLIFITHYKEIILLIRPVRQTELSIVCILLLFKLPNKYFSGFMEQWQFQEDSSGGTCRRGRTFACWNPVVLLCYSLQDAWEGEEHPVGTRNECCRHLGGCDDNLATRGVMTGVAVGRGA